MSQQGDDNWMAAWQPMVDAVGTDFGADDPVLWGERIDRTMLARILEPLEFDCPLHHDEAAAQAAGHAGVIVPYTAFSTIAVPLWWRPGDPPLFDSAERDARPARSPLAAGLAGIEPPTSQIFAVRWDWEFLRPAVVGERIGKRGMLLKSCKPKQIRIGRGAFIEWQTDFVNEALEVVARATNTMFRYNPLPQGGAA